MVANTATRRQPHDLTHTLHGLGRCIVNALYRPPKTAIARASRFSAPWFGVDSIDGVPLTFDGVSRRLPVADQFEFFRTF